MLTEKEQKAIDRLTKKDPELAQAKLAVMASQPSYDELMARDPQLISPEEERRMVEHERAARALWQIKEARAAAKKAVREGADEGADANEESDNADT